ncbi:virion structural protein [Caudoviricetes sp.]|nr:virion structural protein [Caudoviricetes sp.]
MADLGSVGLDVEIALIPVYLTESVVPLLSLSKVVEGVITDDTAAECARTVRLYSRSTGRLVAEGASDAITGEYSLPAPDEEVQRIVLDDDAGTLYNDLIDRVLPGP